MQLKKTVNLPDSSHFNAYLLIVKKYAAAFTIIISFLFHSSDIYAQTKTTSVKKEKAVGDTSHLQIKNADYLEIIRYQNANTNRLIGSVILTQKDITLYCDSALFFNSLNVVKAYGNVHFVQADSVDAYSDSATYDGNTKISNLYKNVKLTNKSTVLTTDILTYNLFSRIAEYKNGGVIDNGETKLSSTLGYYYAFGDNAYFKDSVILTHPKYNLESDTLQYNTAIDRAYFHGPTKIYNKESTIFCVSGYYDSKTGLAVFDKGVTLNNPPQFLSADSIYYNRETGIGKAYRNIVFTDTSQNVLQYSNYAIYNENESTILSTDQSVAAYIIDGDTLFIAADTIRSSQDSLRRRTMFAYNNVKIFKSDLQALCDSLIYNDIDSTIRLFNSPVLWSDSTQFTADTISMIIKNQQLERIEMYSNGFIINEDDSLLYNQIKGRNIFSYFIGNEIRKIEVLGNGESIYYGKDENDAYIGVNKMICSDIELYLKDRKFTKINFKFMAESHFFPMQLVKPEEFLLDNFKWLYNERPKSKEDL